MNLITKLSQLSHSDRIFLIQASLLLIIIRLALLLPFSWWRQLVHKLTPKNQQLLEPNSETIERIVWAVKVASHYHFGVKCLAQAIAVQIMLARKGYLTDLRLGVIKKNTGNLHAHAWLESQGTIIIGQVNDLAQFTQLPPLKI